MEDSCKPEDSIKLEINLNSDLSRLKEYFNLNRLSIKVWIYAHWYLSGS